MRTTLLIILSLSVFGASAQLNGTYTVGSAPSDFATLNAARNGLNLSGVSGPVTFLVKPGTHSAPMGWSTINHMDTITITSQSGDTSNTSIVISTLSDCENIIIKKLKIQPLAIYPNEYPDKGAVIQRCKNLVIDSCLIIGNFQSPHDIAFTFTDSKGGTRISNNTFRKFNLGLVFTPYSSYNSGHHIGYKEISNNHFQNVRTAIKLGGSFHDTTRIEFNVMDSVEVGIKGERTGQSHELNFYSGLLLINSNSILNVSKQAIHLSPQASGTAHVKICNNMLSGGELWSFIRYASFQSRKINHYRTLQVNQILSGEVLNNSIWGGFVLGNVGSFKIRNNAIYSDLQSGFLYRAQPKYHCQNNSFYSPHTTDSFAFGYILGRYLDITSLPDSSNNIWANPYFRNTSDLHACSPLLQSAGKPNNLAFDIDGEPRIGNPDIGADEFKHSNIAPCPFFEQSCSDSTFTFAFTDSSPRAASSLWKFSDGTSYTSKSFSKTFTGTGTYTLKLISSNSYGSDSLESVVDFSGLVPQTVLVQQNQVSIDPGYSNYQWYKDTTAIASATQHLYLANSPGYYRVIYQNELGCMVWAKNAPFLTQPESQFAAQHYLEFYPNPTTSTVNLSSEERIIKYVQVVNLYGKTIMQSELNATSGSIMVDKLARGIYILKVWLKDQPYPQDLKVEIL